MKFIKLNNGVCQEIEILPRITNLNYCCLDQIDNPVISISQQKKKHFDGAMSSVAYGRNEGDTGHVDSVYWSGIARWSTTS